MCLTCCAKVRTPLNSPCVGAKLNLSSGMASAADTTSFSVLVRERSKTMAKVGFWSGFAGVAAWALAETVVPAEPIASMRIAIATCLFMKTASTENVRFRLQSSECLSILVHSEGGWLEFAGMQPKPQRREIAHYQAKCR